MTPELGREAFNRRRFFEAHERWEELWKAAPPDERPYYRALIQLSAACLKIERGEYAPAVSLLRRAQATLADSRFAESAVAASVQTLLARILALGPDHLDDFDPTGFPQVT